MRLSVPGLHHGGPGRSLNFILKAMGTFGGLLKYVSPFLLVSVLSLLDPPPWIAQSMALSIVCLMSLPHCLLQTAPLSQFVCAAGASQASMCS